MSDAADRARKCFALAARASTSGERDAAMTRGWALIERYGLDPDGFDIPGRESSAPLPPNCWIDTVVDSVIDDVFEQRQREDRWKARVNAHERGRDRFEVYVNNSA